MGTTGVTTGTGAGAWAATGACTGTGAGMAGTGPEGPPRNQALLGQKNLEQGGQVTRLVPGRGRHPWARLRRGLMTLT